MSTRFPKSIHFGGGAWATSFHVGVLKALEEQWEMAKKQQTDEEQLEGQLCTYMEVSGDSAGAAIGAGMQLGMTWQELRALYLRLALRARNGGVWCGKMTIYHDEMLDGILNKKFGVCVENVSSLELLELRGFAMGVTRFFNKYERYTSWRDINHFRECLHSSMQVPLYCSYKSGVDGRQAIDGGFSNTSAGMARYEITVGQGTTYHISFVPTMSEIMYPPTEEEVDKKIAEGYQAMMAWKRGTPPLDINAGGMGSCFMVIVLIFRGIHSVYHCLEVILCCCCCCNTESSNKRTEDSVRSPLNKPTKTK